MRKKRKMALYICLLLICLAVFMAGFVILRFRGSAVVHPEDSKNYKETRIYEVNSWNAERGGCVFYRQDDEQWAMETIGHSDYTLAESGCLISCIASAATMMGDVNTPHTLNETFTGKNVFDGDGNLVWDTLRSMGEYEVEVFDNVTNEILINLLENGKYPIVRVRMYGLGNSHYVLIVKAENGEYYCMDPLRDGLIPLSAYGNRVYAVRCVYPK